MWPTISPQPKCAGCGSLDNRSHEEADWDLELLGPELEELRGLDFDLDLTGFDPHEIDDFLSDPGADDRANLAPFAERPKTLRARGRSPRRININSSGGRCRWLTPSHMAGRRKVRTPASTALFI